MRSAVNTASNRCEFLSSAADEVPGPPPVGARLNGSDCSGWGLGISSLAQIDPSSSRRKKVLILGRVAARYAAASAGRVRRRLVDDLARLGLPHELVNDTPLLLREMVGNAVR
jgi:hypothetical protein